MKTITNEGKLPLEVIRLNEHGFELDRALLQAGEEYQYTEQDGQSVTTREIEPPKAQKPKKKAKK